MKHTTIKTLKTVLLAIVLVAAIVWAAVAPAMQALIPMFLAIAAALGLLRVHHDLVETY